MRTGRRELRQAARLALALLCVAVAASAARADVKIKSRQTTQGQTYENATYIKGKRQRTEQMGGQMVSIQQCDLRRDLQLMPQAKLYTVTPYDTGSAPAANVPAGAPAGPPTSKGGVVTMTVTTRDTGERKQMFGYTARRIITTMVTESSPDSCSPMNSKMETDGWYIDAAFQLDCEQERAGAYRRPPQRAGCQDRYEMKTVGAAKRGFALYEKMTMYGEGGRESFTMVNEVVELSQATLDASLFEVPADYREVKDFSAAMMAAAGRGDDDDDNSAGQAAAPSGMAASVNSMASTSGAAGAAGAAPAPAAALGPKKEGVVRIGLMAVKTTSVGEGMNGNDLAAAVQNTLAEYLKGPNVELVRLEAKLPSQAEAEAREKECDYVVYAGVAHKKGGGGGFGGFLKKAAPIAGNAIPYGNDAAEHAASRAASETIYTAADAAENVKAKDELTLDLRVQAPGGTAPAAARQFKAKAKSAGEDIITPLVEQAAQLVVSTAGR